MRKQESPVVVQWDPERDVFSSPLSYRTVQMGLGGIAVELYVTQWIQRISDITEYSSFIYDCVRGGEFNKAESLLPRESPYPKNIHNILPVLPSSGPEQDIFLNDRAGSAI